MLTQKISEVVLHRDYSSTTRIHLSDQMQNVTVGDEFKRVIDIHIIFGWELIVNETRCNSANQRHRVN